jgi:hypothetical protein
MKKIGSIEKKLENLMWNVAVLLSDKLQKCWLCRHTVMANSPLVAIGDRVTHPGSNVQVLFWIFSLGVQEWCSSARRAWFLCHTYLFLTFFKQQPCFKSVLFQFVYDHLMLDWGKRWKSQSQKPVSRLKFELGNSEVWSRHANRSVMMFNSTCINEILSCLYLSPNCTSSS